MLQFYPWCVCVGGRGSGWCVGGVGGVCGVCGGEGEWVVCGLATTHS